MTKAWNWRLQEYLQLSLKLKDKKPSFFKITCVCSIWRFKVEPFVNSLNQQCLHALEVQQRSVPAGFGGPATISACSLWRSSNDQWLQALEVQQRSVPAVFGGPATISACSLWRSSNDQCLQSLEVQQRSVPAVFGGPATISASSLWRSSND